jgi:hypothetical protein
MTNHHDRDDHVRRDSDALVPPASSAAGVETVRILIPDHPDLHGLAAQATQFVADMRATADPDSYERDAEPWVLPEQLVDPRLETALDAVLHPWAYALGDEEQSTGISLRHAGVEHMPVYIAAATREQLDLLAEARDLLAAASDPRTAKFQRTIDLVDFIDQNNDGGARHAPIDAWFTMLRLFDVAEGTAPVTEHRPDRLIEGKGILVRQPDSAGTSPAADTELLFTAIDATPAGEPVELDTATFLAYRRLSMEWHVAIYRDQADSAHATLQTWTY